MTAQVIGLDLSLSSTGLADQSGGLCTIVSKPIPDASVRQRAARVDSITARIVDLTLPVLEHVDMALIEAPAYSQQQQAGHHLRAGLWWSVASAIAPYCDEIVEVPPSTLKKLATGRGNAGKDDMRMSFFQRTGYDNRDDNQIDAFWLRQTGLWLLEDPAAIKLPKANLSALAKVRREVVR